MDICDIHRKFSLTRYNYHTRVKKKLNRSGLKFIKIRGWVGYNHGHKPDLVISMNTSTQYYG
jgi:predicted DNA-binding transcriptional regulator